jgi:hypothetical protein
MSHDFMNGFMLGVGSVSFIVLLAVLNIAKIVKHRWNEMKRDREAEGN